MSSITKYSFLFARKCDPWKDKALFSKENEICNHLAALCPYQFKMENGLRMYPCGVPKNAPVNPPGTLSPRCMVFLPFRCDSWPWIQHHAWNLNLPKDTGFGSPTSTWSEVSLCQDEQCVKTLPWTALWADHSLMQASGLSHLVEMSTCPCKSKLCTHMCTNVCAQF